LLKSIDEIDSYFIDQEKTFKYRTNLMLKEQLKEIWRLLAINRIITRDKNF
jgi:ribosomal protein L15E